MTIERGQLWSVPVIVDDIPETGLHLEIEASEAERDAIAHAVELRALPRLSAVFDLARRGDGVSVSGLVSARVGQTCVVSLEPIENDVEEAVDLLFAPGADAESADAGKRLKTSAGSAAKPDSGSAKKDAEEPPEPIVGGSIDLGAVAVEFLMLGIDPYPRKAGVQFMAPKTDDAASHPFASLAALKKRPEGGPA